MTNSTPMIHSGYLMNLTNLVPYEFPYLLMFLFPFNLGLEKRANEDEWSVCTLCKENWSNPSLNL